MATSIGQFLGSSEEFNLLLQQNIEKFGIGRTVQRRTWMSHRTTIPGVKLHSSIGYKAISAMNIYNSEPTEKVISGGNLYFTELQDYPSAFRMNRRYLDELKQIAEASIGGPSADQLIKKSFLDAIIGSYALNGEVNLQSVLTTDSEYLSENIRTLSMPIDVVGSPKELIKFVVKAMQDIMLHIGGTRYTTQDLTVGEGTSPFKVTISLPLANAIFSEYDMFNAVIPVDGMGNHGKSRTPDVVLLSQLFKGAEIVIPESIQVTSDAVEYEESNPKFVFNGNFITITYSDPDPMKPSTLVYHDTPFEMEDDINIFRDLIRLHQRGGMEVKQRNTMIRIDDIVSQDLYNQFAMVI